MSRPRNIISRAVQSSQPSVSALLPDYRTLTHNVQRIRKRTQFPYELPHDADSFNIPAEFLTTHRNEPFLLSNILHERIGRIIIFSTLRARQLLESTAHIYFDSTFRTVPQIFFKLFSIHGQIHGSIVPLVFVLTQRKTRETYDAIWETLLNQLNLNFQSSLCDFEAASISAFSSRFPDCIMSGCFFHLCQNVWRHIQLLGLSQDYINHEQKRVLLKMLPALAFCPQEHVIRYFEIIEDAYITSGFSSELRPLLTYFEDTYIGRFHRHGRSIPIFKIDIWNQYNRTTNNLPRTNNNVEGWHNAFSTLVGSSHPNIFTFLNLLKDEQSLVDMKIDNINPSHNENSRSALLNRRIQTTVFRFNEIEPLEYIKNISNLYNY